MLIAVPSIFVVICWLTFNELLVRQTVAVAVVRRPVEPAIRERRMLDRTAAGNRLACIETYLLLVS